MVWNAFRREMRRQRSWSESNVNQLAKAWKNLVGYLNTVKERRKRRQKEKEENPYIYPLF